MKELRSSYSVASESVSVSTSPRMCSSDALRLICCFACALQNRDRLSGMRRMRCNHAQARTDDSSPGNSNVNEHVCARRGRCWFGFVVDWCFDVVVRVAYPSERSCKEYKKKRRSRVADFARSSHTVHHWIRELRIVRQFVSRQRTWTGDHGVVRDADRRRVLWMSSGSLWF